MVIPVPRGEKAPRLVGWQKLRIAGSELAKYFRDGDGIGVLVGEPSAGLIDIDLDADEARQIAPRFLPNTALVHGRPTAPGGHFWYRVQPSPSPEKFSDIDGASLVEIRSTGQQTVVPPSIHQSGECRVWERVGEPTVVNFEVLQSAVGKLAAAALLSRHWPRQGRRNDAANALAGMLIRAGWVEADVSNFVRAVATAAGDPEIRQRTRDVISTSKRLESGLTATGIPNLKLIMGDEVVDRVIEFCQLNTNPKNSEVLVTTKTNGWLEPMSFGDELPPVQELALELLPLSFRPFIEDVSLRMQAPLDYAAGAAIVALAGCVGRRAIIQPKAADDSWLIVPNLWGALVGPPGIMKTPILRTITLPLTKIEEMWRAEHAQEMVEYETAKEDVELQKQAWRDQVKVAIKKGQPRPIRPDDTIRPPAQRRLLLTDATFEKIHEILSENPAGLLLIRDELMGWLAGLDKHGREMERAFFLEAWNGNGSFTVDRIGRGSIHVSAVSISLVGNIQPARLRSYLSDALEGGPGDDGLLQRFQILIWPNAPRTWTLVDRPPNGHAQSLVETVFSSLASVSADNPSRLAFCPDAQGLFFEWWRELETKIRNNSDLHPAIIAHLAKFRSLMPSLAGLFELADLAGSGRNLSEKLLISLQHAQQAAALCDYLESHARRVYSCIATPERRAAQELARHIRGGDISSVFTTRDVYLKNWTGLNTPERVRSALDVLEAAAWVRRALNPTSPVGGRPSELWLVNPMVISNAK